MGEFEIVGVGGSRNGILAIREGTSRLAVVRRLRSPSTSSERRATSSAAELLSDWSLTLDLAGFEGAVTGAARARVTGGLIFSARLRSQGDRTWSKPFTRSAAGTSRRRCTAPAGCSRTRQMEASSLWQRS